MTSRRPLEFAALDDDCAECRRLREQLNAANRMIWTLFERARFDAHDREWARGVADDARRAVLGAGS